MSEYVLGRHAHEYARLRFQQEVWGAITEHFLDRTLGSADQARGKRCLDVGCGPGFVTLELARRVGPTGSVLAVDGAEHWLASLQADARDAQLTQVETQALDLESGQFEEGRYDFIFARWVLSFLRDPEELITRLARALKPGGLLAIQDYNHEGISLFPRSSGFEAVIRATRALYASQGGDLWIAGSLPAMFARAGLELVDERPNVLSGGPDSPAFRWADAFFPAHVDHMVELGLLSEHEREAFMHDWSERKQDPSSRFYSPFIVDLAGRA